LLARGPERISSPPNQIVAQMSFVESRPNRRANNGKKGATHVSTLNIEAVAPLKHAFFIDKHWEK